MNRKSALRVMVIEGIAMVPKFLHLYYTAGTTILSPFYYNASLLIPTMWSFIW